MSKLKEFKIVKTKISGGWGNNYKAIRQEKGLAKNVVHKRTLYTAKNDPTCCGVCLLSIKEHTDRKKYLKPFIEHIIRDDFYGKIVYYSNSNYIFRKPLEDIGFKEVNSFINPRTGHKITAFELIINQEEAD